MCHCPTPPSDVMTLFGRWPAFQITREAVLTKAKADDVLGESTNWPETDQGASGPLP